MLAALPRRARMSEAARSVPDEPPQDGLARLQAQLASLRSEGAARLDPVRFHFLDALARRAPGQPAPVRRLLEGKLQVALAEYSRRWAQADKTPAAPVRRPGARTSARKPATPLAQLNEYIRTAASAAPGTEGERPEENELASVRRFRLAWSSSRTQDQVEQAATRKPANAGPLNSHVLVLQSLALMQELSPDYLRRFLVQVESLQWLQEAREKYPRKAPQQGKANKAAQGAKPARRSRPKK